VASLAPFKNHTVCVAATVSLAAELTTKAVVPAPAPVTVLKSPPMFMNASLNRKNHAGTRKTKLGIKFHSSIILE
jgi:hypothetical protein